MKACRVIDLGTIGYGEAWALQEQLVSARKRNASPDVLLLCEHPHVVTLGRSGKIEHLRASDDSLRDLGVSFHRSNRGGDITYHGPGQLVGYPILQLSELRRDVVWYVRKLEEAMIHATASFGIESFRIPGCTGVWTKTSSSPTENKLGAIGVHISRWVTSHGFAYNVSTDLRFFDLIVPCGIVGRGTTSLEVLLERRVPRSEASTKVIEGFGAAFGLDMIAANREELGQWLSSPEAHTATASAG